MPFIPVDLNGITAIEDFSYPPGEYMMQIKEVKTQPTKDGQGHRLVISSQIMMGPGTSVDLQGKPFTHGYNLQGSTPEKSVTVKRFLRKFIDACGLGQMVDQNGGQLAEEWFPGKQYVCLITMKDGYTNVGKERSAAEWTHGTATPAAAAQPSTMQPMAAPQMAAPQMAAPAAAPQPAAVPAAPMAAQQPAPPMAQPQVVQQPQAAPQMAQPAPAVGVPSPPPPGTVPQQ